MNRTLTINDLNIEVIDKMIDVEGWLENAVDVYVEGKFVGNLIEVSAQDRNLKKVIENAFNEILNNKTLWTRQR